MESDLFPPSQWALTKILALILTKPWIWLKFVDSKYFKTLLTSNFYPPRCNVLLHDENKHSLELQP